MTLTLVTVGTGTVAPSAARSGPAHWVERGDVRLLMDCGAGAIHRLAQFGDGHGLAVGDAHRGVPATDADDYWWIPSGQSFFTIDPAGR